MGVCKRRWSDFFVYSSHGFLIERIDFDEEFWCTLIEKLNAFFISEVLAYY